MKQYRKAIKVWGSDSLREFLLLAKQSAAVTPINPKNGAEVGQVS